jgi:hypothetical protein
VKEAGNADALGHVIGRDEERHVNQPLLIHRCLGVEERNLAAGAAGKLQHGKVLHVHSLRLCSAVRRASSNTRASDGPKDKAAHVSGGSHPARLHLQSSMPLSRQGRFPY